MAAVLTAVTGCTAETDDPTQDVCVLNPFAPECVGADTCNNTPRIVRTEFDPKAGRVPFDVTFNVTGEDDDLFADCAEELSYHWDFNGDGVEDRVTRTGERVVHTYEAAAPEPYKVTIWVTDKNGNRSPETVKYVTAVENKPPIITRFSASPSSGMLSKNEDGDYVFATVLNWSAYDPDANKGIKRVELDMGDGSAPIDVDPAKAAYVYTYTQGGTFTARLKVWDQYEASVDTSITISVSVPIVPSSKLITGGSSWGLAFHHGPGGAWVDENGEAIEIAYVADGPISLKTIAYPATAFEEGALGLSSPARLIGVADPVPGGSKTMREIDTYNDLVAVGGKGGLQLFNVNTDSSLACGEEQSAGCFPGTPTAPVAVCSPTVNSPNHIGRRVSGVKFVERTDGQPYLIASIDEGVGDFQALYALPVTGALNPAGYARPNTTDSSVRCWDVAGVSQSPFPSKVATFSSDMAVDENGYAWLSINQNSQGLGLYRLRDWLDQCPPSPAGCAASLQSVSTNSLGISGTGHHVGVTKSRPITADLTFESGPQGATCEEAPALQGVTFTLDMATDLPAAVTTVAVTLGDATLDNNQGRGYAVVATSSGTVVLEGLPYSDPVSWAGLTPFEGGSTFTLETPALKQVNLKTQTPILPGNRVAVRSMLGDDNGDGSGYAVVANEGNDTVLDTLPLGREWLGESGVQIVTTHLSWARLPAYPGSPTLNPVSFSGAHAGAMARNNRCWNVVNAYEEVGTLAGTPVTVDFTTAPLAVVGVSTIGTGFNGFHIIDALTPTKPRRIASFASESKSSDFRLDREKMFLLGKTTTVVDLRDPYLAKQAHDAALANSGFNTFAHEGDRLPPTDVMRDIVVRRPASIPDADNSDGIALIANGFRGLTAVYLDKARQLDKSLTSTCLGTPPESTRAGLDSPCMKAMLPGLQLAHEGTPNDIQVVDGRYALIAQGYGGVAMYDMTEMIAGRQARFLTHIPTSGNPKAVRVTRDAVGEPEWIFIADSTSVYRVPYTDPTAMPSFYGVPGKQGHGCLSVLGDTVYACWGDGKTIAYGTPEDFPTFEGYINIYDSLQTDKCVVDESRAQAFVVEELFAEEIAGRRWLMADTDQGNMILELDEVSGDACFFPATVFNYHGRTLAYNRLPARDLVRRLYAGGPREIAAFDLDSLAEEAATQENFSMRLPPLLSTLRLPTPSPLPDITHTTVTIRDMQAVGPYIFASTGEMGAWVIDATNPSQLELIGRTKLFGTSLYSISAQTMNAMAKYDNGSWTYYTLVSDLNAGGTDIGGIALLRYMGLEAPE